MNTIPRYLTALVLVTASTFCLADQTNWPQWRGASGDGVSTSEDVVTKWDADSNVKWRIDLPEAGNSTPVVWGDRIFLTQPIADENSRAILCLDRKTGDEKWRQSVVYDQAEASHKTNPYCSASPATDGDRVIAWLGSAGLLCWDMDGNEVWRRDLGKQDHMWGYGTSPILHDDLCILMFGPGDREFMIAVDKATGETRWQVETLSDKAEFALSGPENDGGSNDFQNNGPRRERLRGAWSTPIVVPVKSDDGETRNELIATLPRRVSGFDPVTGELLWTCGGGAPLAYASPVESGGVVVALGGYRGASLAVRAGGRGDVTQTHRLWHKPNDNGWLGTGVAVDGNVYVCDMGGVLTCLDVQTGDVRWKDRTDGGGTWSSITKTADDKLFLLTKSGVTTVFQPSATELKTIATNKVGETTNASVVIAGTNVLVRTDKSLWCFAKP